MQRLLHRVEILFHIQLQKGPLTWQLVCDPSPAADIITQEQDCPATRAAPEAAAVKSSYGSKFLLHILSLDCVANDRMNQI